MELNRLCIPSQINRIIEDKVGSDALTNARRESGGIRCWGRRDMVLGLAYPNPKHLTLTRVLNTTTHLSPMKFISFLDFDVVVRLLLLPVRIFILLLLLTQYPQTFGLKNKKSNKVEPLLTPMNNLRTPVFVWVFVPKL